uniref:Annexin n=1 Tax=Sinocyclocheilus rhinocerous TaxID=307959 RepID=A0A673MNQ6_9TELE
MAFFKKFINKISNDDSSKGFKGGQVETAYFGTVKPDPNFNGQNDAAKLKKAIETKGVDEATIVEVIAKRSNAQRQQIKEAYQQSTGKVNALKKALKSDLEEVVLALLMTPTEYDAFEMKRAMKATRSKDHHIDDGVATSDAKVKIIYLHYVLQYYGQLSKDGFAKDLEGELHGMKAAWNKPAYFAERLHLAMKVFSPFGLHLFIYFIYFFFSEKCFSFELSIYQRNLKKSQLFSTFNI